MTREEFLDQYFEIKQRLEDEARYSPVIWSNEDWSQLIYGTSDDKTYGLLHDMIVGMEDTGNWIARTLFKDYPENSSSIVEIEGVGKWMIDYPSQLYDFLSRKREKLIPDKKVIWLNEAV